MQTKFKRFFLNNSGQQEAEEVVRWMEHCDNEALLNNVFIGLWQYASPDESDHSVNQSVLLRIHNRIEKEKNEKLTRRLGFYRIAMSVAAVLFTGLIVTGLLTFRNSDRSTTLQEVLTPYGGRMSSVLPDGTQIWLNSNSKLSFPGKFGKIREVYLTGEAYFQVAKDSRPFIVKCQYGTIEARGTAFNVRIVEGEPFMTTLVEGSVNISLNNGKTVALMPGFQATSNLSPSELNVYRVDTYLFTSWKDGKLIFRKEPLGNMIRRLESWYNVKIELKDKSLEKIRFTGTIEMESFSEVLELIKTTTPIRYSFDTKSRVLSVYKTKKP